MIDALFRSRRFSLFLIVAACVAGALAVTLQFLAAKAMSNTVPVVVSREVIPARSQVKADMVEIKEWPKSHLPEGAFTKLEEVEGKWTTGSLPAGIPLTQATVTDKPGKLTAELSRLSRPEMRYVVVPADRLTAFGGELQSGDIVDVVGLKQGTATVLAKGVPVENVYKDDKGEIKGVLLRLSVADAFKVEDVLAVNGGKIRFWVSAIKDGGELE